MRLNTLPSDIRVIVSGLRRLPYRRCLFRGLSVAPTFLSFAFAVYSVDLSPVRIFFGRRKRPTEVGLPCLRNPGAPIAETAGGYSISMQYIPTRIVSLFSIARKTVQLTVCLNHRRRRQPTAAIAARNCPLIIPAVIISVSPIHFPQ